MGNFISGVVRITTSSCLLLNLKREEQQTFEGKELPLSHLKFYSLKRLYERNINSNFSTNTFMDFLDEMLSQDESSFYIYYLRPKLLILFRKSNFLSKHYLMHCLLVKKVQVSKTTFIHLNSRERMILTF